MKKLSTLIAALVVCISSYSQSSEDYSAEVLHAYFDFQLELIKETPGFTPPVASRSLGYAGLCAYEAIVHGYQGRSSLSGLVPQLTDLPLPTSSDVYWPEVANRILHDVVLSLYSNMNEARLVELEDLRDAFNDAHSQAASPEALTAAIEYAEALSAQLLSYADGDGQVSCQLTNFPADYEIPTGPGFWVPLPGQAALQPYWGEKRCFVSEFVTEEMISPAPPEFSAEFGSVLYEEALAVYNAALSLTDEEINIAQYWADGPGTVTPPGHSISMLMQILELEESNLAFAAEAYARVGMAVADAFVQCWKTKYLYNLERPITYIRSHIDADWNTLIGTPPFPEYTSGHSSQSGAWGEVMTALFGENYSFTDHTHGDQFGGPRTFSNFADCAEETAVSRLYGGIHYPIGNTMGSMSGMMIGQMVNDLFEQTVLNSSFHTAQHLLEVYPNPSLGQVFIKGHFDANTSVTLFDMTGRMVSRMNYQPQLEVSNLPAGLYVLSLNARDGALLGTTRLVLQ